MTYIAVILKNDGSNFVVERPAALTSTSKEALVRMALDKRESMYRKNADAGYQNDKPYRIFIGELTEEVVMPLDYKLIPISEGAGDGKR